MIASRYVAIDCDCHPLSVILNVTLQKTANQVSTSNAYTLLFLITTAKYPSAAYKVTNFQATHSFA